MKRHVAVFFAAAIFVCPIFAAGGEHEHPAQSPNALFEAMKPLAGEWEGTFDGHKVHTSFALVANDSAMIENLMPESEKMVNMIHPDGAALMMTHYCAGASQPRFRATKVDGNRIVFDFVDGTNLGDSYMSGVTVTLVDKDHMTQEWKTASEGGDGVMKFEFTRIR